MACEILFNFSDLEYGVWSSDERKRSCLKEIANNLYHNVHWNKLLTPTSCEKGETLPEFRA